MTSGYPFSIQKSITHDLANLVTSVVNMKSIYPIKRPTGTAAKRSPSHFGSAPW